MFRAEWDDEGVYFYQAYNAEIAGYAVEHQRFGGPLFKPHRMTWIKPSFGWMLYRAGYGRKPGQEVLLKIKLPHAAVAELLEECTCKHGGGGGNGRVQWDPERDLQTGDGNNGTSKVLPRKMLRTRSIQIGLAASVSERYVASVLSIEDVTPLARRICDAHASPKTTAPAMAALAAELPNEREYMPRCADEVLVRLGLLPGETADWVSQHGLGFADEAGGRSRKR